MANIDVLNIFLNNREIGAITRLPGDRNIFTFNQSYIDDENRPTLSLSFKDIYGGLITNIKPTQTRLPPFFSNLLPEGMLREYLAKQAGVKPEREFYLLWALGQDLPGAVKALPENKERLPTSMASNISKDEMTEHDNVFRFSLAGVQLKFSALLTNRRGLTIPSHGVGGNWIVKLPDTRYPHVPENEYMMMEIARGIGINVPQTMLIPLDKIGGVPQELKQHGAHAFAIKRFDRTDDGTMIHIEDFAQILNVYADKKYGHGSYRNIAEIIWAEVGEVGLVEFFRRLVFNILIGNGDMHLKNWSFIYPNERTPTLAPAYDFVSTLPYIKHDTLALTFVDTKVFSALDMKLFSRFAAKSSLPEKIVLDTVTETIELFRQHWRSKAQSELDKNTKNVIEQHLKTLRLW